MGGKNLNVNIHDSVSVYVDFNRITVTELIKELSERKLTIAEKNVIASLVPNFQLDSNSLIDQMKFEIFLENHKNIHYNDFCDFFEGDLIKRSKKFQEHIKELENKLDDGKEQIWDLEEEISKLNQKLDKFGELENNDDD